MEGAQLREFQVPRFVVAVAVVALFSGVLAPAAGATSPSQDQYGSAIPGVGGSNGGGSPSASGSGGGAESTIPVAPSSSSTSPSAEPTGSSTQSSGGAGGSASSHSDSSGATKKSNGTTPAGGDTSNHVNPIDANPAGHSVPQIAADSAGDSWVPWFIGGLLALGAAGAVLVYRNRRRAAQP
jgi:hypothetical protein